MKILHISDTHGKHSELTRLPEADIIVHSGDFTFAGSEEEAYDFMNWFCALPYPHKIFIAGNHDNCLYGANAIEGLPETVHYLCNSSIKIDGLLLYGIPMFMEDVMTDSYEPLFDQIPSETDILITHQPPYGYCDLADYGHGPEHRGNKALRKKVDQLSHLSCHLFGHEHDTNDITKADGTIFSNADVVDEQYNLYADGRLIEI